MLVSAFLWQGTPNKLIEVVTEGEVQLFTSRVLLDELTEVLHRKKFESAVSATGLMAGELVSLYRRLAYRVTARKPLTPI